MDLALLATVGGSLGLLAMIAHLFVSTFRLRSRVDRLQRHMLEIAVGEHVTTINLNAIGTEDPAKIDETIKAIRVARELEHT